MAAPVFIPEAERNEHAVAEVCASLHDAVRRRSPRAAWCYLESARVLACALASDHHRGEINMAAFVMEADLQNELWAPAARTAAAFERAVRAAVVATRLGN